MLLRLRLPQPRPLTPPPPPVKTCAAPGHRTLRHRTPRHRTPRCGGTAQVQGEGRARCLQLLLEKAAGDVRWPSLLRAAEGAQPEGATPCGPPLRQQQQQPPPGRTELLSEAGEERRLLVELRDRGGGDLAEWRALLQSDRDAFAARLKALGFAKLGTRMRLESALARLPGVQQTGGD